MLIPSWLKMNLGAEVFRSSSLEDKNNPTYKYTCKDPNVGQAPSLSGQGRLCAFPHVPACQLAEGPVALSCGVCPRGSEGRGGVWAEHRRPGPLARPGRLPGTRSPAWLPVAGCWPIHPRVTS